MSGIDRRMLAIMAAAAGILMITMGMRQTLGLYIAPIIDSTHVGYAAMSFALAIGQLMWGVAQPAFGALADRHGPCACCVIGALMLAAGTALTPFATNEFALIATIGVLTAAGAGAGSFGVLFGVVAQRVPATKRSFASGFVNAGGSLGQFVFAPLTQLLISSHRLDGRDVDDGGRRARDHSAGAAAAAQAHPRMPGPRAPRGAGRHAERAHDARATAHRRARQELLVPARRLLHLRLSHRVPRHASAGRSEPVRPARVRGRELARHHRPRQRRR